MDTEVLLDHQAVPDGIRKIPVKRCNLPADTNKSQTNSAPGQDWQLLTGTVQRVGQVKMTQQIKAAPPRLVGQGA